MPKDQMVLYFFMAVGGFFALVIISNLFKRPARKRVFQDFARKYGLDFKDAIDVSVIQGVGQVIASAVKEASERRRLSKTPGVEDKEASRSAQHVGRQALTLKNAPAGSILADPHFFDARKTQGILNYCAGRWEGMALEVCEELRLDRIRPGIKDRRPVNRTYTKLAFKLEQTDLPAFQISTLRGSRIGDHPNRVPMPKVAGFDDSFAVVAEQEAFGQRDRINRLLTGEALKHLMILKTVNVRAKGAFVVFSRVIPKPDLKELDTFLEQGLAFVRHLNAA